MLETRTPARRRPEARRAPRPGRRALVRGAAWATPAVALGFAAPALAASPCAPQAYAVTFADGSYSRSGGAPTTQASGVATATGSTGGSSFAFTVRSVNVGSVTRDAGNLLAQSASILAAGVPGRAIEVWHTAAAGAGQVVTVTFDRAVSDLRFTLLDIDTSGNTTGFLDNVSLTPAPTAFTYANPNYLQGTGVTGNTFRPRAGVATSPASSSNGNVSVTIAGPTSSVAIRFVNGRTGGAAAGQSIGISSMTFTAAGC